MQATGDVTILKSAQALSAEIVQWRRAVHRNPELGFCEEKTQKFVVAQLEKMGLQPKLAGGTGVIADIGDGGKLVALRADMDALPIGELNKEAYTSENKGVMHACGHDAHIACVLGAARLLCSLHAAGKLPGRVRLLFQPAEEIVNGDNKSGATLMLESGALADVSALVALHVFPGLPSGNIGIRSGPVLAACDSFDIKIQGKGCHGAQPDTGVDAVVLAAQAIQALQTVVSRRLGASEVGLLTVGGIRSSTYAPNVVSDSVDMTGTVRYMNIALQKRFEQEINRALSVVTALGGSYNLSLRHETPVLCNDERVTKVVHDALERMLGTEALAKFPQTMGAEDFAFYTAHVPCCFVGLGVAIEGRPCELHSPYFDLNEGALPIGSAILTQSALALVGQK